MWKANRGREETERKLYGERGKLCGKICQDKYQSNINLKGKKNTVKQNETKQKINKKVEKNPLTCARRPKS